MIQKSAGRMGDARRRTICSDCWNIISRWEGYGKSEGDFSFEAASLEIEKLIDCLSPDRNVILIAHSYGGLVVKQLLVAIPDKIDRIVTGSTNLERDLLFRIYTSFIGCLILWMQNRDRFIRENISWKQVCDTQRSAWRNFAYPRLQEDGRIPCLFLYAGHNYFRENAETVNHEIITYLTENKFG